MHFIFQDSQMNRNSSKEQHLFEIEIFCNMYLLTLDQ